MVTPMRLAAILFAGWAAASCTADLVKTEPADPRVKTIGLSTGTLADDGVYKADFERAARKACQGSYTLLERSRQPSTMRGVELAARDFYWVVRCQKAAH